MHDSTDTNGTALAAAAPLDAKQTTSSDTDTTPEPDTPRAWLVVIGCMVYNMMSIGIASSFGVYMDEYLTRVFQETPSATLAWIGTMQFGLLCLCGIVVGPLMERIDLRIIGGIGILISSAGFFVASACTSPASLIVTQGIITGIGSSAMYTIGMALPSQWMDKYRPIAVGLSVSGSALGGLWQSFVMRAIIKHHGYQWALRATGLLQIVLCGAATIPMKRRIEAPPCKRLVEYTVISDLKFVLFFLFGVLGSAGFSVPFTYMPTYTVAVLHKSISWDGNISAIMNAGGFIGRLVAGVLGAYTGPLNGLIFSSTLSALVLFVLWLPFKAIGVIIPAAFVYGVFSGGILTLLPFVAADLFGIGRLPSVLGLLFVSTFIGQLISTPVAGHLLDIYGHGSDFKYLIIYGGTLFAAGTVFLVYLRAVLTKNLFERL